MRSVRLESAPVVTAPDGSVVRILPTVGGASMVHVSLSAGAVSRAVYHRTVEELWYCVGGVGRLWRSDGGEDSVIDLSAGVGANIPLGVRFQFRNDGRDTLEIVIATVPAWPGEDEAVACDGEWEATA